MLGRDRSSVPGTGRYAARGGAAASISPIAADRAARTASAPGAGVERARAHRRRRDASGDAARRNGWPRARSGGSLPALASVALIGGAAARRAGPRGDPTAGGTPQPLIAAQRYGQGRSMVFAGEASWRWRMMRPASDTSYETIWRQLVRWVAAGRGGPRRDPRDVGVVAGTTDRSACSCATRSSSPSATPKPRFA